MAELEDSRQADTIEITEEMIAAGVTRLIDLLEAEVGQSYLVEEVYRAMRALGS